MGSAGVAQQRWVQAAIVAVVAAGVGVGGLAPVASAETGVNCNINPQGLQPAIDSAAPGATLFVIGTCTGNFVIDKDLTLTGRGGTDHHKDRTLTGRGGAVLDGTGTGTVVRVNEGARVQLISLTITKGTASAGGGIHNAGILRVTRSTVRNNSASGNGGGIYNRGIMTLNSTTVRDNTAVFGGGGIENFGTLTVNSSTVHSNTVTARGGVTNAAGGGISNSIGGTLTLYRSIVRNNDAEAGGGIDNAGTARVIKSTVNNNTADDIGGGIRNIFRASLRVVGSTVRKNTAGAGGGIFNLGGTATVANSIVRDNKPNNCVGVTGCGL